MERLAGELLFIPVLESTLYSMSAKAKFAAGPYHLGITP